MGMKRRRLPAMLLLLAMLLSLPACAGKAESLGREKVHLFYPARLEDTRGGDAIRGVKVKIPGWADMSTQERAQQVLVRLLSGGGSAAEALAPDGTRLNDCVVLGGTAQVDFSEPYGELSGMALTIADYCVTLSLTQIPGIYSVRITVEGEELAHRDAQVFRPSDMLLTSEEDVVRSLEVMLYFPDAVSGELMPRQKTLTLYEGESAMEVLLEALAAGPEEDGLSALLPAGFQVLTVRLADDGVCHLNLPQSDLLLLPADEEGQSRILEGIVRSLCSLDGVESVQFLVDGEMKPDFGLVDISQPIRP